MSWGALAGAGRVAGSLSALMLLALTLALVWCSVGPLFFGQAACQRMPPVCLSPMLIDLWAGVLHVGVELGPRAAPVACLVLQQPPRSSASGRCAPAWLHPIVLGSGLAGVVAGHRRGGRRRLPPPRCSSVGGWASRPLRQPQRHPRPSSPCPLPQHSSRPAH